MRDARLEIADSVRVPCRTATAKVVSVRDSTVRARLRLDCSRSAAHEFAELQILDCEQLGRGQQQLRWWGGPAPRYEQPLDTPSRYELRIAQ